MALIWKALLIRWVILALGVGISASLVPGIRYDDVLSLLLVVVLLSFFNAFLKPLLLLFTLPFIVLTLGIGIWMINAFLFLIAGRIVPGFEVAGFGSALLGALVVSLLHFFIGRLFAGEEGPPRPPGPPRRRRDDDVIDI